MTGLALSGKATSAAMIGSAGGEKRRADGPDWEAQGPEDEIEVLAQQDGEFVTQKVPWVDEIEILGDWVERDGEHFTAVRNY